MELPPLDPTGANIVKVDITPHPPPARERATSPYSPVKPFRRQRLHKAIEMASLEPGSPTVAAHFVGDASPRFGRRASDNHNSRTFRTQQALTMWANQKEAASAATREKFAAVLRNEFPSVSPREHLHMLDAVSALNQ